MANIEHCLSFTGYKQRLFDAITPMLLRSSRDTSSCCSRTGPAKANISLTKMRPDDCASGHRQSVERHYLVNVSMHQRQ